MCSAGVRRSKWYFLPSLVTTVVLDAFVLISGYFLFELLRNSGCTTVLENVVIPFLGTVPFVFLSKCAGKCYRCLQPSLVSTGSDG